MLIIAISMIIELNKPEDFKVADFQLPLREDFCLLIDLRRLRWYCL